MLVTTEPQLILPPGVKMPEAIETRDAPDENATPGEKATVVPDPTGWRILCMVPPAKETFDGSAIVKANDVMRTEEHATTVLFVVKVGPLAYKDKEKFGTGGPDGEPVPWCKEGDFVLVRTYSGTRFKVFGREMRILNDDQIDAVVSDPRGVTRA